MIHSIGILCRIKAYFTSDWYVIINIMICVCALRLCPVPVCDAFERVFIFALLRLLLAVGAEFTKKELCDVKRAFTRIQISNWIGTHTHTHRMQWVHIAIKISRLFIELWNCSWQFDMHNFHLWFRDAIIYCAQWMNCVCVWAASVCHMSRHVDAVVIVVLGQRRHCGIRNTKRKTKAVPRAPAIKIVPKCPVPARFNGRGKQQQREWERERIEYSHLARTAYTPSMPTFVRRNFCFCSLELQFSTHH